jgi:hypothetical protein
MRGQSRRRTIVKISGCAQKDYYTVSFKVEERDRLITFINFKPEDSRREREERERWSKGGCEFQRKERVHECDFTLQTV